MAIEDDAVGHAVNNVHANKLAMGDEAAKTPLKDEEIVDNTHAFDNHALLAPRSGNLTNTNTNLSTKKRSYIPFR